MYLQLLRNHIIIDIKSRKENKHRNIFEVPRMTWPVARYCLKTTQGIPSSCLTLLLQNNAGNPFILPHNIDSKQPMECLHLDSQYCLKRTQGIPSSLLTILPQNNARNPPTFNDFFHRSYHYFSNVLIREVIFVHGNTKK